MKKEDILMQINNENYYTVPNYLFKYTKDLGLDMNSLILLIYLINKPNKMIFDYKKIIEDLNFNEKELLDAISILKEKNILLILMEKNDAGVLEEKIDVSLFYEIIFTKLLNSKKEKEANNDLYNVFETEFGRTLSPMEYEIIESWREKKVSDELIITALKEAVYNGVSNLRYIDKILYEWGKKGVKTKGDVAKVEKEKEEEITPDNYDYDWLNN